MGFLVSSPNHKPEAFFESFENAEGYLCSKASVSRRFTGTREIPNSTMTELFNLDNKETLGYIVEGIEYEPKYFL